MMMNQSLRRKQSQIKWNEVNSQQDDWPMPCRLFPRTALSFHVEERILQNNLQANVENLHNAHAMFSLLKCFTDAAQPMCLSPGFSSSSCHELSLFCVYCRSFLWSICSPCAGSQHKTGLPVCPSTPSVPKALNLSSLPVEWVGFADMDTEGLCTPPPSYSWSVFPWWWCHCITLPLENL